MKNLFLKNIIFILILFLSGNAWSAMGQLQENLKDLKKTMDTVKITLTHLGGDKGLGGLQETLLKLKEDAELNAKLAIKYPWMQDLVTNRSQDQNFSKILKTAIDKYKEAKIDTNRIIAVNIFLDNMNKNLFPSHEQITAINLFIQETKISDAISGNLKKRLAEQKFWQDFISKKGEGFNEKKLADNLSNLNEIISDDQMSKITGFKKDSLQLKIKENNQKIIQRHTQLIEEKKLKKIEKINNKITEQYQVLISQIQSFQVTAENLLNKLFNKTPLGNVRPASEIANDLTFINQYLSGSKYLLKKVEEAVKEILTIIKQTSTPSLVSCQNLELKNTQLDTTFKAKIKEANTKNPTHPYILETLTNQKIEKIPFIAQLLNSNKSENVKPEPLNPEPVTPDPVTSKPARSKIRIKIPGKGNLDAQQLIFIIYKNYKEIHKFFNPRISTDDLDDISEEDVVRAFFTLKKIPTTILNYEWELTTYNKCVNLITQEHQAGLDLIIKKQFSKILLECADDNIELPR